MGKEKLQDKTNYIIYGSEAALRMYEESVQILMASDTTDFDVVRCTPSNTITSLLDDFVPFDRFLFIDAKTYKLLHENLCHKIHKIMGQSENDLRFDSK